MSTTITNLPETSKVNGSDYLILDQPDKTVKSTVSKFLTDTGVVLATQLKDTDGADLIQSSNGNTVQEELNNNLLNDREQWHRSLAEAGLTLVDGSFEEGATVNSETDAVWHIAGGQCYTWGGEFPKTASSGSTPEAAGGIGLGEWVSVGDASLRSGLASYNPPGTDLIGTSSGINLTQYLNRIFIFIDDIPGVDKTGVMDSSAALNAAITTYSGVGVEFIGNPSSTYLFTSTVQCIGVSNITLNFNGAKIMDNVQGFIPESGGRANHTFVVYNSKKSPHIQLCI